MYFRFTMLGCKLIVSSRAVIFHAQDSVMPDRSVFPWLCMGQWEYRPALDSVMPDRFLGCAWDNGVLWDDLAESQMDSMKFRSVLKIPYGQTVSMRSVNVLRLASMRCLLFPLSVA